SPVLATALSRPGAGPTEALQAATPGSLLGNALPELGLAFIVGGLKHGPQRFDSKLARDSAALGVLALAAMVVPSLAAYVHAPAGDHEDTLSMIVSVVLIAVFALSLPSALRRRAPAGGNGGPGPHAEPPPSPLADAVGRR